MRLGIIFAVLVAAAVALGLGAYLYDLWLDKEIADIRSRLVTEAELARPDDPATTSGIRLAPIQCERVYDLRGGLFAYALKGEALDALWRHCERIADLASGLNRIEKKLPE